MRNGEIRKRYLAILDGVPREAEGVIETYMRRTAESVIVRENCGPDEGGDLAITRYRVLCENGSHALVCASPITGRTHQIRVHFAGIGCPLTGDDLYGTRSSEIGRHALHSCALSFPRPSDAQRVTVSAGLPDDMCRLTEQWFGVSWTDADIAKAEWLDL
jgi:23S rRNA pseudouridine1911/1915/1917 synthase